MLAQIAACTATTATAIDSRMRPCRGIAHKCVSACQRQASARVPVLPLWAGQQRQAGVAVYAGPFARKHGTHRSECRDKSEAHQQTRRWSRRHAAARSSPGEAPCSTVHTLSHFSRRSATAGTRARTRVFEYPSTILGHCTELDCTRVLEYSDTRPTSFCDFQLGSSMGSRKI